MPGEPFWIHDMQLGLQIAAGFQDQQLRTRLVQRRCVASVDGSDRAELFLNGFLGVTHGRTEPGGHEPQED